MNFNFSKRTLLAFGIAGSVAIGAGVASIGYAAERGAAARSPEIGADKARELAEKAVGGQAGKVELEREWGKTYYDVDVYRDHREYDVHIDAYTGKTLKSSLDDREDDDRYDDGYDDDSAVATASPSASPSVTVSPSPSPAPSASPSATAGANKPKLTAEQAKKIAADRVKGTVVKAKLDRDDGFLLYEIELRTDRGEAEVDVDARTGKILSIDYDDDDRYDDDRDDRYDD